MAEKRETSRSATRPRCSGTGRPRSAQAAISFSRVRSTAWGTRSRNVIDPGPVPAGSAGQASSIASARFPVPHPKSARCSPGRRIEELDLAGEETWIFGMVEEDVVADLIPRRAEQMLLPEALGVVQLQALDARPLGLALAGETGEVGLAGRPVHAEQVLGDGLGHQLEQLDRLGAALQARAPWRTRRSRARRRPGRRAWRAPASGSPSSRRCPGSRRPAPGCA